MQITSILGLCLLLFLWTSPSLAALQLNSGWKLFAHYDGLNTSSNGTGTSSPGPRSGASLWKDGKGQAWVFGGRGPATHNTTHLWADLWVYDAQLQTWQRRIPHSAAGPIDGREQSSVCGTVNGTVVIFGGQTANGVTGQLLVYRPGQLGLQIHECQGACPEGRYDALVWCNEMEGTMHVMGGYNKDGCLISDAWKLDIVGTSWTVAKMPLSNCSWSHWQECSPNRTDALSLLWQSSGNSLYLMCDEILLNSSVTVDNPNIQLWKFGSTWNLEAESGKGAMTWPGMHQHGGTCTDTRGNLWLFGGQSHIGGSQYYLNNDVWVYNVSSHMWFKAELPSDGLLEPEQRHLAVTFCHQDVLWVYGGLTCNDASLGECIRGDLWMLNVSFFHQGNDLELQEAFLAPSDADSRSAKNLLSVLATPSSGNLSGSATLVRTLQLQAETTTTKTTTTAIPTTTSIAPFQKNEKSAAMKPFQKNESRVTGHSAAVDTLDKAPGKVNLSSFNNTARDSLTLDSGRFLHSQIPGPHSAIEHPPQQEVSEGMDHGAYGSAIFFGISLSMFTIFGVILFFRRCVSCPPRDNMLLKEAPPVRYTVIPDDTYSI